MGDAKKGLSSGDERWTLEDYVMELFLNKKTQSEEFQAILRIYGRDKMEIIKKKFLELVNQPK